MVEKAFGNIKRHSGAVFVQNLTLSACNGCKIARLRLFQYDGTKSTVKSCLWKSERPRILVLHLFFHEATRFCPKRGQIIACACAGRDSRFNQEQPPVQSSNSSFRIPQALAQPSPEPPDGPPSCGEGWRCWGNQICLMPRLLSIRSRQGTNLQASSFLQGLPAGKGLCHFLAHQAIDVLARVEADWPHLRGIGLAIRQRGFLHGAIDDASHHGAVLLVHRDKLALQHQQTNQIR